MLLCSFACAQTTITVPSTASDDCEDKDCIHTVSKPGSQNRDVRVYDSLPWQTNDAERYEGSIKHHRGEPSEHTRRNANNLEKHEPEQESEFQKFIFHSTGIHLPILGHDFFRQFPDDVVAADHIPVPADYSVVAGDQIFINIWGQIEVNSSLNVDRNGQIYLPKIGMITVVGVRYDQMREYLRNVIGKLFKGFDLSVSLGQLHSERIYVTGNVRSPGLYLMGSLSTVVNALSYAGGPSGNGSMRHVQLKRQGQVIAETDLYDLLLYGGKSKDAPLLSGDVIYVPPVGPQVAVLGSVKQAAIYELKGPTTVGEQIAVAGGLNATADTGRIALETIENQVRKVENLTFNEAGKQHVLRDGDVLRFFPVSPRFENAVTLRGNVARPGRYPWHPGMKIQDLIPSREALVTSQYWMTQDSLGQNPPGWLELSQPDGNENRKGVGREPARPAPNPRETTEMGAEQETGQEAGPMPGTPGLAAKVRSLAEINWDYAVVQRLDSSNLSTHLLPFNLGRALAEPNAADNLALEAGDVVTVFSQRDLSVPTESRTKFIRIEGEVKAAGIYRAEPGETLRQIVDRAGGLTPDAYLFASVFERQSTRREQQKELDHLLNDMEQEMRAKAARLASAGSADERAEGREELELERSMMEKLRQSPVTGRIVLDLKSSDTNLDALPALSLEDGDRIVIPSRPATIGVIGAVNNQGAFIYREGKSMRDYLSQSGGPTRNADAGRMFILRADGSVLSKQMHRGLWSGSLESMRLVPGDTIVVPERVRASNLLRGIRDWSQVFAQFALGAAAVRVVAP
jgi:polysaccharide export outer membrane protein